MSMPTVRVSVLSSVAAIAVSVTAFAITAPASVCAAALAPLASRDLDFTPSALRLFKDPESGKHYWYMSYDVVNNTGQDQRFAPRIEMLTDEGHVVRQGDGVPGSVSKQIMKYLGNELLEDQFEILGEFENLNDLLLHSHKISPESITDYQIKKYIFIFD